MSGYEIYKKVILRLGYSGKQEENSMIRVLEFINQILTDLNIKTIEGLAEEIVADTKVLDAVCCGTAMLFSLSESDGEKNALYTSLYNAKRSIILAKASSVSDVLPIAEGEV